MRKEKSKQNRVVLTLLFAFALCLVFNQRAMAQTGDSKSSAQVITMDTSYDGTADPQDGEYWYKFKTGKDYKDYHITVTEKNGENVNWCFYDTNGVDEVESGYSTNEGDYVTLKPDTTYYLTLRASFYYAEYSFSIQTRDDVSDDFEAAVKINCGTTYKGNISNSRDVDWYKFVAPVTGNYKIVIPNNQISSLRVLVYDAKDNPFFKEYFTYNGGEDSVSEKMALKKGKTYYVRFYVLNEYDDKDFEFKVVAPSASSVQKKPGKTSFKTVAGASKKVKLTWKKANNASGYLIRYATNKSMKKAKTVSVKGTKKTITKLKGNTRYYLQIKSYVKNANGKKTYSGWSAVKSVKTKR